METHSSVYSNSKGSNFLAVDIKTRLHFLAEYGMDVMRGVEPGLYVDGQKIAAFGIRIDRGVSLHGLAININNDLESFSLIRQCGQVVRPTNLVIEMGRFGAVKDEWNFAEEAEKWMGLFLGEIALLKGEHSQDRFSKEFGSI